MANRKSDSPESPSRPDTPKSPKVTLSPVKVKSPKLKVKLALSPKKPGSNVTKSKGSSSKVTGSEKRAQLKVKITDRKSVSEKGSKWDHVAGNDVDTGSKQTEQEAEMTSAITSKSKKIK